MSTCLVWPRTLFCFLKVKSCKYLEILDIYNTYLFPKIFLLFLEYHLETYPHKWIQRQPWMKKESKKKNIEHGVQLPPLEKKKSEKGEFKLCCMKINKSCYDSDLGFKLTGCALNMIKSSLLFLPLKILLKQRNGTVSWFILEHQSSSLIHILIWYTLNILKRILEMENWIENLIFWFDRKFFWGSLLDLLHDLFNNSRFLFINIFGSKGAWIKVLKE